MDSKQEIDSLVNLLLGADRVAVLTGAGISAESGIPTFRGKEGLWKQYRAEDLATPEAFARDPELVWKWYDWRRSIIAEKAPNAGHQVLSRWEDIFTHFDLITQNIDGFHQKAGSTHITELHGNIWKFRCTEENRIVENFETPLENVPPICPQCGELFRPHVVWFGEPLSSQILQDAFTVSSRCQVMFVIGTSAVVQPAASLPLAAAQAGAKIIEINPDPTPLTSYADFSFRGKAGETLPAIESSILQHQKDDAS